MEINFSKYHGTANDFILIEDPDGSIQKLFDTDTVAKLCNRRFGIGADGLMLLQKHEKVDFYMRYYNSDGNVSSMCGNGGRCLSQFAIDQGWISADIMKFEAVDGMHRARVEDGKVLLTMSDVEEVRMDGDNYILNTGSPHFVSFQEVCAVDIYQYGKSIRYSEAYKEDGINVNVAEIQENVVHMLTYERGVEDETYSCGTGTVAVAIACLIKTKQPDGPYEVNIKTRGGDLSVRCQKKGDCFDQIYLIGPAVKVYEGKVHI